MSIVAALKKKGEIWVMADRQTTWYHFVRDGFPSSNKLTRFKHAFIGHTGTCVYGTALKYLADTDKKMYEWPFESQWDVLNFFIDYYKVLKDKFNMGDAKHNEVAQISNSGFLVVTADKIFEVAENRDVTEFDDFTAIGSGHQLTLGAMVALDKVLKDPEEVMARAYEVCCLYNRTCGGDIQLINATRELTEKPPKRPAPRTAKATTAAKATKTAKGTKGAKTAEKPKRPTKKRK